MFLVIIFNISGGYRNKQGQSAPHELEPKLLTEGLLSRKMKLDDELLCHQFCNASAKMSLMLEQEAKAFYICLTNRFHVAVRLLSNRSQMTSKCDKKKKVAHEP